MLFSVALILLSGLTLGTLCQKAKLPGLLGMLAAGMILGPFALDLLDSSILDISAEIRKMALVIILMRAGLGLDLSGLKRIGRPAIMMCFVPATFEILGMLILGPALLGLSLLEAAILGAVLAAVSPAVVVPRMVRLTEEGYGVKKGIPQVILAGASVDDVYVIVLFTTFVGMAQGKGVSVLRFVNIPVSIVLGILAGMAVGFLFGKLFQKLALSDTVKVLLLLAASLLLVVGEDHLTTPITYSALIAVMVIGIMISRVLGNGQKGISAQFGKLWIAGEVFLFVLVGASVNLNYLRNVGITAILMIGGSLIFRMLGVFVCLLGSHLLMKEKLFTMFAYTPKATVQAAIGGIPLSMGLSCGNIVLTVSVLAIVLTAPVGAFIIDLTYRRWLQKKKLVVAGLCNRRNEMKKRIYFVMTLALSLVLGMTACGKNEDKKSTETTSENVQGIELPSKQSMQSQTEPEEEPSADPSEGEEGSSFSVEDIAGYYSLDYGDVIFWYVLNEDGSAYFFGQDEIPAAWDENYIYWWGTSEEDGMPYDFDGQTLTVYGDDYVEEYTRDTKEKFDLWYEEYWYIWEEIDYSLDAYDALYGSWELSSIESDGYEWSAQDAELTSYLDFILEDDMMYGSFFSQEYYSENSWYTGGMPIDVCSGAFWNAEETNWYAIMESHEPLGLTGSSYNIFSFTVLDDGSLILDITYELEDGDYVQTALYHYVRTDGVG